MIILSNALSVTVDEGCLKVANSLVKRIKAKTSDVTVVSYERCSALTDIKLELNKFLLNRKLACLLGEHRDESVLYIPFPAKPLAVAIRVFVLSCFCRRRLRVLLTMNVPMGPVAKLLYRLSGAPFFVLSNDSRKLFSETVGDKKAIRLKTGVDTQKFLPVTEEKKKVLKEKYGFEAEMPVVLHVGHLTQGRNVEQLLKIDSAKQVVLVTSTLTKEEQDIGLREQLLKRGNIRIISEYIPEIQEVYQLADVYFFPVQELGHCIDVPLSCLEAAACNTPIVTTDYGEMKEFRGREGFFYLESFDKAHINCVLENAVNMNETFTRNAVMEYDWNHAIELFLSYL